jgi:uncharacterized protein (DUF924 family)
MSAGTPGQHKLPPQAAEVLDFWLADGLQLGWPSQNMGPVWFGADPALDQTIRTRFGEVHEHAITGRLAHWQAQPLNCLALVIVLDQFSRNMFRGTAQAYAGDAQAQALVQHALALGLDQQLPWVGRVFMYMPLMHAEDLALQQSCVRHFTALASQAPEALQDRLKGNLDFAHKHLEIIQRFGRFPYRNAVLGRSSSAQELEFLQHGPRFGQ